MTNPRTQELIEISNGLYLTIKGLTDSPYEFMEIISMLHLLIYMNHGTEKSTIDEMLANYAKNFKQNWAANKARAS